MPKQACQFFKHGRIIAAFGFGAMALTTAQAQTIEQRIDKIILDANLAKNANARVEAEAKRLKADLAKPPVVVPPVVTPPHHTLLPTIDNSKIPAPVAGYSTLRIQPTAYVATPNADGTGQFRVTCTFSHMNYDDAIVYPGQKGASHLHTYFGNTGANFASTQASIETTGNSTCDGGIANRTGYWVPAVIDTKDGTPLKPDSIIVYYKTGNIEGDNVKPFPAGLRIVQGDMRSTGPQNLINWNCIAGSTSTTSKTIPADCPVGGLIEASIDFPFCWDGVNLDSPDHKSHMSLEVWSNTTRKVECPATHPVELPMIAEKVRYKVTEAGSSARWRLSSDNYGTDKAGGYSLHADWFNGWDAKVQDIWVKNCLQANKDCGANLLGDGTTVY